MNLTSFQSEIKWATQLDSEPEIYADGNALYVDFFSTVDQVAKAAPDVDCIDLYDGDSWVAWVDASISDDGVDSLQRFRWIVAVD